jgi:hypothetical protein
LTAIITETEEVEQAIAAGSLAGFTMKIFSLVFLLVSLPVSTNGQYPPIGIIDFYGLRSVSQQQARQALQIKVGDSMPDAREEIQRRLEALPNVEQAQLGPVCCEAGKSILYVGIREKGAPVLRFRPAPTGTIRLPEPIVQAGSAFYDALTEGIQAGDAGEDDSQGYALNSYPKLRAIQERFIAFAAQNFALLRAVLHESADPEHRALAAQVIAYASNKQAVVKDLVDGMSDPDSGVRNSSMRALGVLASFAQLSPKQHIKVPVTPFIKMLNSLVWTDRNKSSSALDHLTEKRNPAVLSQLRKEALPALIEMARWKSPGHAGGAFFILGRCGNLSEEEILKDWASGNREILIDKVLRNIRKVKRRNS